MSDMEDGGMGDVGGGLDTDLPTIDAEPVDGEPATDGPATGEDIVDAEFVVITPDGTELSSGTELEVAPVTVIVTDIDGEPVPLPGLPTLDDPHGSDGTRPGGGSGMFADGSQHGQPKFPGAGGGSKAGPGAWGRRKKPKAAGASFGSDAGGGSGSLFGFNFHFFSGASVIRNSGPIASPSPQVTTGVVATTGASKPKAPGRRPLSSGPRRPTR